MPEPASLLALIGAFYLMAVTIYIVSENRRPQSSFAWLLLFVLLPVAGLALYVLFGRMRGGKSPGAPKGNVNALNHGRYTVEAVGWRRDLVTLRV